MIWVIAMSSHQQTQQMQFMCVKDEVNQKVNEQNQEKMAPRWQ